MDPNNKIKIYNKYANYPDIKNLIKISLHQKPTFISEKLQTKNKIYFPMKRELRFFSRISKKITCSSANHVKCNQNFTNYR